MASAYICSPSSGDEKAIIYSTASLNVTIGIAYSGAVLDVISQTGTAYEIHIDQEKTSMQATYTVVTESVLNSAAGGNAAGGSQISNSIVHVGETVTKVADSADSKYTGVWIYIENPQGIRGWILTSKLAESAGSYTSGWMSASDVSTSEEETNAEEYAEWLDASSQHLESFTNYSYDPTNPENMEYWNERIEELNRCFGCPPKYNMDVDIQYESVGSGIGRVMATTFYSNPSILSICPGKVKLFPSLFGVKKDLMMDSLVSLATGSGLTDLAAKLSGDEGAKFSGKMYDFSSDTAGFANQVNLLCRACAVLLGIGDENMPGTTTKLKNFDYSYWSIRKEYSPAEGDVNASGSIFADFWNAGKAAVEGAVTDKNYIHFILSNSSTQISESITTDVSSNSLMESLRSTVNSATSTLSYFLNTGFNETQDLQEVISEALTGVVGSNGWTKLADNLLKGGQMVFPNQITGASYSQSVSCAVNFVSPYGDPLSVFLWCIVPVMHLYALALPKQVADNTFTFPFICRVCQKGWFNSNIACITDLNVQRGGSDDTSWTLEGLATDWVVSFSVVPLLSQLMVTSTENPFMFMKNDGLIDYLGNLCSFDLKANNATEKMNLFMNFAENKVADFFSLNRLGRKVSDGLSDKISKYFQF